jgi:hypothetical protein
VAVIRYSGFWSDSNYNDHLASLQAALSATQLTPTGQIVYALRPAHHAMVHAAQ